MDFCTRGRIAAVTTEVVIGLALATVVLFVALGLFNDNLAEIVKSSGFSKMFTGENKTTFSSENPDYTNSQVNIQLTGDHGVLRLRKNANNWAEQLISKPYGASNTNGDTIAYLVTALNYIVGSPDVCVTMDEDSDETCDKLNGYRYKINSLGGPSLSISETKTDGTVKSTIQIRMHSNMASIISASSMASLSDSKKMKFYKIKNLSEKSINFVNKNYLLTVAGLGSSNSNSSDADDFDPKDFEPLKHQINGMFTNIEIAAKSAMIECSCVVGSSSCKETKSNRACVTPITFQDYEYIVKWVNQSKDDVKTSTNYKSLSALLERTITNTSVLSLLRKDNITCDVLKTGLSGINDKFNQNFDTSGCYSRD